MIQAIALLICLALLWGPSFMFIKIAIADVPPMTTIALRILIGAFFLILIAKSKKYALLKWRIHWKDFLLMGIFSSAFPFTLIAIGEKTISSSTASVVNASVPFFTLVMAHFFIASEKITKKKMIGILVGFIGINIIFLPSAFKLGCYEDMMGIVYVIIASISYGVGMIYAKKKLSHVPTIITPIYALSLSGIILLILAFIMENPFETANFTQSSLRAIGFLSFFGTSLAYLVYFKIIKIAGPSFLSLVTFISPVISIFLGIYFLQESPSWNIYLGCVIILIGLGIAANSLKPTNKPS